MHLRSKPRLQYNGLTVILSNPSRFDRISLLSADGGTFFNNECLRPEFNTMMCDVRVADDTSPLLDNTKCVLLLGEYALHKWVPSTARNTLNEMRGSPLLVRDILAYASFYPQDCTDIRTHEQELNPNSKEYTGDGDSSRDEDDEGDVKRFSNTKRSNYAFWLRADVQKCKQVLLGNKSSRQEKPTYKIYPPSDEVIQVLRETKGGWLDFDIETDYEEQNLLCFSFTFDGVNIYCVPVLDFEYRWAYSNLHYILFALSLAIKENTLVAHNGAGFDFFILAHKYKIPIHKTYDTMIAQHRIFPDTEKSLGHVTSYWTNEVFHKDSDSRAYFTREHMMQKLLYCGKDVYTMRLVREAQQKFATTIPGLQDSIDLAMRSIRPYLITSLMGISYNEQKRASMVAMNDRLMMQYLRIINLLIGPESMAEVRTAVKGKAKGFPNSNKQCVKYFHDMLGYKEVQRNPPDQHGVRNVSLAKKAMLKLALIHDNPVISLVNAFRYIRLESTTPLGFLPWKDDNGKVITQSTDSAETKLF